MFEEFSDCELVLVLILSSVLCRFFGGTVGFFSLLLFGKQLKKAEDIETLSNIPIIIRKKVGKSVKKKKAAGKGNKGIFRLLFIEKLCVK